MGMFLFIVFFLFHVNIHSVCCRSVDVFDCRVLIPTPLGVLDNIWYSILNMFCFKNSSKFCIPQHLWHYVADTMMVLWFWQRDYDLVNINKPWNIYLINNIEKKKKDREQECPNSLAEEKVEVPSRAKPTDRRKAVAGPMCVSGPHWPRSPLQSTGCNFPTLILAPYLWHGS